MKMLKREQEQRQAIEMLCVDMLVPKDHLLRKIDAAVDFTHIYDLVEDLYCEDNGRPSCDPVVLFKLVLIQHLFGIRSLRQTMKDAEVNVAYCGSNRMLCRIAGSWGTPWHSRFRILRRSAMRFAAALPRK